MATRKVILENSIPSCHSFVNNFEVKKFIAVKVALASL